METVRVLLEELGRRWQHVRGVGETAEGLLERMGPIGPLVVRAAWWHDVGYAPELHETGHHAIDGALYLKKSGRDEELVNLVAWHTGSEFEAEQRGLLRELEKFPKPNPIALDLLTLIDLSTGPDGEPIREERRIAEILNRYGPRDPVHRAVAASGPGLIAASTRAKLSLGLPDCWPIC
ncbi:hypothetical protein CGZ94_20225 [Enemella evansiae]|uniref:HD domain-containing protein n=1 Tax=Enemella evansiae TaxID=2016499 RepID=A0A255FYT5_9ACTN|nr:HD domain-containing protein [Enemella evansiae]OYO08825.1 hypothetical protein CGZ94_20225 [Enemella evansiae]